MNQLLIAHYLIVVSFPAFFVFSPSLERAIKSTHIRFVVSIILSWVFLDFWRHGVELPIALDYARSSGDSMYDGTGGNAVVFLLGWIEPALFGLPAYIMKLAFNERKNPMRMNLARPERSGDDLSE